MGLPDNQAGRASTDNPQAIGRSDDVAAHAASPPNLDRMAYAADMILELKELSAGDGHATLAGILALAHAEALRLLARNR